ncbi:MAG TPA: hypothetical protein VFW77_01835 [Candidatus Saccharimonadales bacterium]|nr:hypothetical protein [Candidatus Saccharimonadales bacterium]
MSDVNIVEKIAGKEWLDSIDFRPEDPRSRQVSLAERSGVVEAGRGLMEVLGIEIEEVVRKPVRARCGFKSLSGREPIIFRTSAWKELRNGEKGIDFESLFARITEVTEECTDGISHSLRTEKATASQLDQDIFRRYGTFGRIAGQLFVPRHTLEEVWTGFVSDASQPCMFRTELITGDMIGDRTEDLEILAEDMRDIALSDVAPVAS